MGTRKGIRAEIHTRTYDIYFATIEKEPKLCGHAFWDETYKQVEKEYFMNNNLYDNYKNLYESVKPIRGRAEDVRPLGQRRRDWETIEKRGDNYACRLYQTDVVTYYPDNSIGLVAGVWATPLTAEFMHTHSPFYCYKKYNKLWARVHGTGEDKHYPIPESGELRMVKVGEHEGITLYEPSEPIVIQQRVIDRAKAKEAREKLKPFLDWGRMMLKLSDGWIMTDTREQFCKEIQTDYWHMRYTYMLPDGLTHHGYYGMSINNEPMYEYLCGCGEDGYMPAFLAILNNKSKAEGSRKVREVEHIWDGNNQSNKISVYDLQFSYDFFKRQVYAIADKSNEIHKMVEVEIGDKALTNVS
jgi:hypothetical protein